MGMGMGMGMGTKVGDDYERIVFQQLGDYSGSQECSTNA
jgi:hypothetical protein